MESGLEAEIAWRASQGWRPVSIRDFEARLETIGYRRDRSMECRGLARIMTGERAGASYPCITTTPVEADTGLRFCNVEADRGARFEALKALRGDQFFAVTRGAILEI